MDFPYEQIIEYCKEHSNKEACGLVIVFKGRLQFIPCENVSSYPRKEFVIHPEDYAQAEDKGEVVAVVHSHPFSSAAPSETDIYSQRASGVDWLIIGLGGEVENETFWLKNTPIVTPLYGRKYVWHVQDCGSFIQDFYKQEFDISLPDFYRPEKFWEKGIEVYLDNYAAAGFVEIPFSSLSYGDVVLMNIGSSITTHGAIYLGDNLIGHHITGRLSSKDVYGQYYRDRTTRTLRHKDRMND